MKKFLTFFAAAAFCSFMICCGSNSDDDDDDDDDVENYSPNGGQMTGGNQANYNSYGNQSNYGGQNSVVGNWELVKECSTRDGDCKYYHNEYTYINGDGTFSSVDKKGRQDYGSWQMNGNLFIVHDDNGYSREYAFLGYEDGMMVMQRSGSHKKLYFRRM